MDVSQRGGSYATPKYPTNTYHFAQTTLFNTPLSLNVTFTDPNLFDKALIRNQK